MGKYIFTFSIKRIILVCYNVGLIFVVLAISFINIVVTKLIGEL